MSGLDLRDLAVSNNPVPAKPVPGQPQNPEELTPESPPEPELTPEQKLTRRKTYLLAKQYLAAFPTKLAAFQGEPLEDLSQTELDEMLKEMRLTLQAANSIGIWQQGVNMGIATAEALIPAVAPIRLEGFTAACLMNTEIQDSITEMALEYGGIQFLPPHLRLTYSLMAVAWQTHAINSQNVELPKSKPQPERLDAEQQSLPAKPAQQLQERYADL